MFLAVLKALPQFLPFLLTLLRGDKAPMSGQTSTFNSRLSTTIMIGLAIGTGILYLDYTNEQETTATLTKEVTKLKKEGVVSPENKKKMQELNERISELDIKLKTLGRDRDNIISENNEHLEKVKELRIALEIAQEELLSCKRGGVTCPTVSETLEPDVKKQSISDLIKQLDQIGKKKDKDNG